MLSRQQQSVCRQLQRLVTAEWRDISLRSTAVSLEQEYHTICSHTGDGACGIRKGTSKHPVGLAIHQLSSIDGHSKAHHRDERRSKHRYDSMYRFIHKDAYSYGRKTPAAVYDVGSPRHSRSSTIPVCVQHVLAATSTAQYHSSSSDNDNDNSNSRKLSKGQNKDTSEDDTTKYSKGGWSYEAVVNLPNSLSMLRLLSGPAIGHLIIHNQMDIAIPALLLSALTDWLDGYVARRQHADNVLGSYLDPLADKVLVGSVVLALGYSGALPLYLFNLIVGRDVLLVAGACIARGQTLGWTWPGWTGFFNISGHTTAQDQPAAPKVEPLFISKVNTVVQLTLISSCLTDAWIGWPGQEITLGVMGPTTAITTIWSFVAYVHAYRTGRISL